MDEIVVNEESTVWLLLTFEDRDGNPQTPQSIKYRVDSDSGEVTPETSVTPAQEVEIEISAQENTVQGDCAYQDMHVTVIAVGDPSTFQQKTKEFKYKLKNLRYI